MRNIVNRMVVVLGVAIITSASALAHTTKKDVTFAEAVTVNGVLVKQGTYQVRFDDEANQLTISKRGKVVASAGAQLETVQGVSKVLYVTRETDNATQAPALLSISLKSKSRVTIVDSGS